MRIFGKEFRINGFRIYHEGDKPAPSEIGAAASSHSHSNYLPTSGGSVTGNINMSENKMLLWNNKGRIYMKSNQQMYLAASSEGTYYLHLGVHDGVWTLDPDTNGVLTLGTANHRWGQIYSSVASIKTSDRNQKKNIEALDGKFTDLFRKLQPVSFQLPELVCDMLQADALARALVVVCRVNGVSRHGQAVVRLKAQVPRFVAML